LPELPEVETVRRGLEPTWVNHTITHVHLARAGLRWPFAADFSDRLKNQRVVSLARRAKYLLAGLENGDVLVMHLGMSGAFRVAPATDQKQNPATFHIPRSKNPAHDHVTFTFENGNRTIYNDPRRFGFMLLLRQNEVLTHPLFASLGMEPLGNELNADSLLAVLAGTRSPLKAALLDQRRIAGLGNIYVCEALHRAGLSPFRPAQSLSGDQADRLVLAIRNVLMEAVAAGGSTLRDHTAADGSLGYFQHSFRVYDRQSAPCPFPGCSGVIERTRQGGRSTFWCAMCQV
jgi:formamidopyrimidine-DNA glycosylase